MPQHIPEAAQCTTSCDQNRDHVVLPAGPRALTTFLIHHNSRESRDSDDQMQKALNRTKKRPESLGEAGQSASKAGSR
jgi:hypothetical protein